MAWPERDDDDAYVLVDHRAEECEVVADISARLSPEDRLEPRLTDAGELWVHHQGGEAQIPLTFSPHDRYVAISSVAALLDGRYRIYVEEGSLGGDTHALLVVAASDAATWGPPPPHLRPLVRGRDYFSVGPGEPDGIAIPYLGHPEPGFEASRTRIAGAREAGAAMTGAILDAMLTGRIDDAALAKAAAGMVRDPRIAVEMQGKSEAEVAAALKEALGQSLRDPRVQASHAELIDGLNAVRRLTGTPPLERSRPPKPWWKFW